MVGRLYTFILGMPTFRDKLLVSGRVISSILLAKKQNLLTGDSMETRSEVRFSFEVELWLVNQPPPNVPCQEIRPYEGLINHWLPLIRLY